MHPLPAVGPSRKWFIAVLLSLSLSPSPSLAADEADGPKGAAVTVLKAAKSASTMSSKPWGS
jgi:hypothetical protein